MKYQSPIDLAISSTPSFLDAENDMDDYVLSSFSDELEEPDEEELARIAAEEGKAKKEKSNEEYFSTELEDISYTYHIWRKKAEKDGKRKPIHSETTITCPTCGRIHDVKNGENVLHKTDIDSVEIKTNNGKILYSLLRLYDYAFICPCEKFLYGHYQEPTIPKWLSDALGELEPNSQEAKTQPKKESWKQLSFEDIYDVDDVCISMESTPETTQDTVETIEMEMNDVSSNSENAQQLSDVNVMLKTYCEEKLNFYSANESFASLSSLKTAEITREAKRYSVLNFARMNNNEKRVSIGLILIMLGFLPTTFDDEQKLSVAKILARADKSSSEMELKSLSFFSEEDISAFMESVSSYKADYDELQELTKTKIDLSKTFIWGKSK